jgi:hypothetical protein
MALAPFFDRIYGAVGMHLSVSRESLTRTLESVEVGIRCSENLDGNDIIIADLTTNLLVRLYPKLCITGSATTVDRLRTLALSINPNVEFVEDAPFRTSVCVGMQACDGAIFPRASGWVAELSGERDRQSGPFNPYAASAAATFACAALFRRIFQDAQAERDFSLSLLDFGRSTGADRALSELSIGSVLFIGTGAVGNAALWTLSRDHTSAGTLHLVDGETLDLANLQRYVLGTMSDVGKVKTDIAAKVLEPSRLVPVQHVEHLENLSLSGADCPAITCISIDNIDGRRAAQALLPRLIINGWTGENSLGVSWHEFSRNAACLACLYHPRGQGLSATQQAARAFGLTEQRAVDLWVSKSPLSSEELQQAAVILGTTAAALDEFKDRPLPELYTTVVCGGVSLDLSGLGSLEVVPLAHQSALAGVLMAAELIKRSDPQLTALSQSEPLVSWEDVLRGPPPLWTRPRAREKGCICSDPIYQDVYQTKWAQTESATENHQAT